MHNRLWHFETHDVFSVCEFSCIHANADFCVACKRGLGPDRRATARPPTLGRSRVLMPVRPPPSTAAVRAWVEAKARARIRKQPRRTEGGLPNLEATVASSGPLESSQASSAAESHREIAENREIAGNHREIAGSTGTSPHRSRPLAAADLAGPSEGVRRAQVPTGAEAGGCEGGGNGCEGVRRAQVATGAEAGGDTRGNGCEGGGNGNGAGGGECGGGFGRGDTIGTFLLQCILQASSHSAPCRRGGAKSAHSAVGDRGRSHAPSGAAMERSCGGDGGPCHLLRPL